MRGAWLALAAVLLVSACSGALRTETGLVIAIDSAGLGRVSGFTLRTADGREVVFDTTRTRFDAAGFPPSHLGEHQALAEPIRVTYQDHEGARHVVKLEDADE